MVHMTADSALRLHKEGPPAAPPPPLHLTTIKSKGAVFTAWCAFARATALARTHPHLPCTTQKPQTQTAGHAAGRHPSRAAGTLSPAATASARPSPSRAFSPTRRRSPETPRRTSWRAAAGGATPRRRSRCRRSCSAPSTRARLPAAGWTAGRGTCCRRRWGRLRGVWAGTPKAW